MDDGEEDPLHLGQLKASEFRNRELEQEIAALNFQLSAQRLDHEQMLSTGKLHLADIEGLKQKISQQECLVQNLQWTLAEMREQREESMAYSGVDIVELREALVRCEGEKANLEQLLVESEAEKSNLMDDLMKRNADIQLLRSDNAGLRRQLVHLVRDKDHLWKKADRLEAERQTLSQARWMADEATTHCLRCRTAFSFLIRRHHCRICGLIFCRSCANNWLATSRSAKKTRVCSECFTQYNSDAAVDANPAGEDTSRHMNNTTSDSEDSLSAATVDDALGADGIPSIVPVPVLPVENDQMVAEFGQLEPALTSTPSSSSSQSAAADRRLSDNHQQQHLSLPVPFVLDDIDQQHPTPTPSPPRARAPSQPPLAIVMYGSSVDETPAVTVGRAQSMLSPSSQSLTGRSACGDGESRPLIQETDDYKAGKFRLGAQHCDGFLSASDLDPHDIFEIVTDEEISRRSVDISKATSKFKGSPMCFTVTLGEKLPYASRVLVSGGSKSEERDKRFTQPSKSKNKER